MKININELAPWVAIAVTLILSILIPLFTQIANNRFQLKKGRQDRKLEEQKERLARQTDAFEHFLVDVGSAIALATKENIPTAGSSIGRLYLYVSSEWHHQLDELHNSLRKCEWEKAEKQYAELAKMLAKVHEDMKNTNMEKRR